jgi:hypothetical protein
MAWLAIFLGTLACLAILLSLPGLWNPRKQFAVFVLSAFLAFNGAGLVLPADTINAMTAYGVEPLWLAKSGLAYIPIIISLAWFALLRDHEDSPDERYLTLEPIAFWVLAAINGVFASVVLWFMVNDGFDKINIALSIDSFDTLYQNRYGFEQSDRRGWFSSFVIYRFLGLITCGIVIVYARTYSLWLRYLVTVPLLLVTLMRSATELQRGPALVQLLLVCALIAFPWIGRQNESNEKRSINWQSLAFLALIFLLVVGGGSMLFSITHEDDSPLWSLARRVFVIPSHTASLYFGFFPDAIPFRGIGGTFSMPLGDWKTWSAESFNLKQIGYHANGEPHHPNANIIATAFSGAGWISVFLMSAIFIPMVFWFNRQFAAIDRSCPLLAIIVTFHGVYAVMQADFLGAVSLGFGIAQVLLLLAAKFCLVEVVEESFDDEFEEVPDLVDSVPRWNGQLN